MIKQAVILAAGMGSRLETMGREAPKGFIRIGERPIIEESLDALWRARIERVVVVTGHLNGFYDDLAAQYPGRVETVHNPLYADSGSMYSLSLVREMVQGDLLLLESDLIYESRAITALMEFPRDDAILVSGTTNAGDEVYVTGKDGCITGMSKNMLDKREVVGELVGISKISEPLYQEMLASAKKRFSASLHIDYETDCLVAVAAGRPIPYLLLDDLLWTEIDDASQLQRAVELIHPAIMERAGIP